MPTLVHIRNIYAETILSKIILDKTLCERYIYNERIMLWEKRRFGET